MRREEEIDLVRKATGGETEGQDRENKNNQEAKVGSVRTTSSRRELVPIHLGSLRPPRQYFSTPAPASHFFATRPLYGGAGGFPAPRAFPEGESTTSFPRRPCAGAPWASRPGRGGARRLRARKVSP